MICSEDSDYNQESGMCEWLPPNTEVVCPEGTDDSGRGSCEWVPDIQASCEDGEYNPQTGKCVISPGILITAEVDEVIALTLKADVENIIITTPANEVEPDVIDTIIEPNRATVLLSYDEIGEHVLTMRIIDKFGEEITKDYRFKIKSASWFKDITGWFTYDTSISIMWIIVVIVLIGAVSFLYIRYRKMNPWERRRTFRIS